MKYLQFDIGGDHFAVPVAQVEEVTPLVRLHELGKAHEAIAGLMEYRGKRVPVLDMSQLVRGKPCRRAMSTRIIIINCGNNLFNGLAGLLAENVLDLVTVEESEFSDTGVSHEDMPFLGGVASVNGTMTQLMIIQGLKKTQLAGSIARETELA